jgi:hypothetical protein
VRDLPRRAEPIGVEIQLAIETISAAVHDAALDGEAEQFDRIRPVLGRRVNATISAGPCWLTWQLTDTALFENPASSGRKHE